MISGMKVRRFDLPLRLPSTAALPQPGSTDMSLQVAICFSWPRATWGTLYMMGWEISGQTEGDVSDFERDIAVGADWVISQNC